MSQQVTQEKVDEILADMAINIPNYEIIYKDEPLPKVWYLQFIFFLASFWGFFNRSFRRSWNESISNGIGHYIIFPSRKTHGNLKDLHVYTILRHEYMHLLDWVRNKVLFLVTYIGIPLPTVITGRAHWELRGYTQNMIVLHEEGYRITDQYLEWIAGHFSSSLYFWMFPFKKTLMKKLKKIRAGIVAGEITGFDPDIKLWSSPSRG